MWVAKEGKVIMKVGGGRKEVLDEYMPGPFIGNGETDSSLVVSAFVAFVPLLL